jgi:hypothetical protein
VYGHLRLMIASACAWQPRKGTFELRTEDGEVLFELHNLQRPFRPLKVRLRLEDMV